MKRLWAWLIASLYGFLVFSGLSFAHHTAPADSKITKIGNITQNTPLYLEHSGAIHSNPADTMLSWHYSHESHSSHYSHYSHYSGR
jgi:hypothetical protein